MNTDLAALPATASLPSTSDDAGSSGAHLPGVAAVVDDGRCDVDALLADFARRWQARGRRVHGLLMRYEGAGESCASDMVLIDVQGGERYLISQPLGSGAQGCRADPDGFARAGGVLRRALAEAPELVICNRFGGLEEAGEGFTTELLDLMAQGLPLLIGLSVRRCAAWAHFTGGTALVEATPEALDAWARQALGWS